MLLGVHMLPALTSATTDRLRIIVYLMSAVVGYVIFMISLFNIYPLRYHKGKMKSPSHTRLQLLLLQGSLSRTASSL